MNIIEDFLYPISSDVNKLLRKKLEIDCDEGIFSTYELSYLVKYGALFDALCKGIVKPLNELQQRFVSICKGEIFPFAIYECAWIKYMNRQKIEEEKFRIEKILLDDVNGNSATNPQL